MTDSNWLEPRPRLAAAGRPPRRIIAVDPDAQDPLALLDTHTDGGRAYIERSGWQPKAGRWLAARQPSGELDYIVFAADHRDWQESGKPFVFGDLPHQLATAGLGGADTPETYEIVGTFDQTGHECVALGWLLGSYSYRPRPVEKGTLPSLLPDPSIDVERTELLASGVWLARRLIETPANELPPSALAAAAAEIAEQFGADFSVTVGDDLLRDNWPLIHAVGRAGSEPPRLVDFSWGDQSDPSVTLVGKGICFDTGGLDLKPSANMLLMKKDMGGAASVLATAYMVMARKLRVRLRVLLPIAENSVSSTSFRPGDVLPSRKELSVEVGNTDAEGRLVLADALTEADSHAPELLIDFATLTGAARVALGADLPALYTADPKLGEEIWNAGCAARDPLWRMPLWKPYMQKLNSRIADVSSTGTDRLAGSITAALFLSRFIKHQSVWAHIDLFGWTPTASPGRPQGAECQAARAIFQLLEQRYGAS